MRYLLVILIALLSGCSSVSKYNYEYQDCRGIRRTTIVEERMSSFPPLDCAALAGKVGDHAAAMIFLFIMSPAACAVSFPNGTAIIILPWILTDHFREHELAHVRGEDHPWTPFAEPHCSSSINQK